MEHRLSQLVSYFLQTIINYSKLDPKINSRLLVKHISRPSKLLGFHYKLYFGIRIRVLHVVHIGDKEHQYQPAIYIYIYYILKYIYNQNHIYIMYMICI